MNVCVPDVTAEDVVSVSVRDLRRSAETKRGPFCCDKPFHATPCQNCGGFRIDGSFGVSGTRFENLPETVRCLDCSHPNPLRDPGPEETAGAR